jgi:hypothetical protein
LCVFFRNLFVYEQKSTFDGKSIWEFRMESSKIKDLIKFSTWKVRKCKFQIFPNFGFKITFETKYGWKVSSLSSLLSANT